MAETHLRDMLSLKEAHGGWAPPGQSYTEDGRGCLVTNLFDIWALESSAPLLAAQRDMRALTDVIREQVDEPAATLVWAHNMCPPHLLDAFVEKAIERRESEL